MNRTILIADDDPNIRALVKECLTDSFTTCTEACDGADAVRVAGRVKPDAILLDMSMPGLDGFEACRSLKANPSTRRIPVVFLTSNGDVPDKVRGLDVGASDYITKPFQGDELRARMRSVLRSGREMKQAEGRVARDELTGLFNRHYLDQRIEADLAASRRHNQPLACCVATAHDWDQLTDERGASASDELMRRMAQCVLTVLRREDVACRYDERTVAVLAFTANRPAAMALGQRVHAAIDLALSTCEVPKHRSAVDVGVALSHYSMGDSLLWHATEALRHARLSEPGTVQFGGELMEFQMIDRSLN